jgi:subtilisin family serine protease
VVLAWLGAAGLLVSGSTTAAVASTTVGHSTVSVSSTAADADYVVVLKDAAELKAAGITSTSTGADVKAAVARGRTLGAEVTDQFTKALPAYSAELSTAELAKVEADPRVDYVQPIRTYRASGTNQKNPPSWGLDRVDQRKLPLNKNYYRTATGKGVTAFIVDTGIAAHADLPHVAAGLGTVTGQPGTKDCNGHGTHVAGTVGGTKYGVAKDVKLVPIRVLNCRGVGSTPEIIAGLDAILEQPVTGPRVANLSLGYDGIDKAVDDAVKRVIAAGVTVVLAAGNGDPVTEIGQSACLVTPAHVRSAITVGATDSKDRRASFSNYASCVDLYAPGVNITSTWLKGGKETISGTSMAAPHVTGTVAMYLERHPKATPAQVQTALLNTATKDKVTNVSSSWPRLMLMALQKAVAPKSVTSGNKLRYNQSLVRGKKLCSANGAYCLSVESSGKLVLRKVSNKKVIWTGGKGSALWTRMTSTGALSSYDTYGRRVWTNGKTGGKATLYVVSSGYLKVARDSDEKTLWSSR